MGAPDLLALSLGLSIATAGAAWLGGRAIEAMTGDPGLRDRIWGMALALPLLPPLAVALALLAPAPVREIAVAAPRGLLAERPTEVAAAPVEAGHVLALDPGSVVPAILVSAGLLALWRLGLLALGARRLARLLGKLEAADGATVELVHETARRLPARPPRIGVSAEAPEPMLAGVVRPRLILPRGLTAAADPAVARAMIAHELIHLQRGDHRTMWFEEALLALLAFNPLMPALRARRAAAREEACDARALADAGPATRRAYAECLIEALRRRAGPQMLPALTFTGAGRRTAMNRLKAVMTPSAASGAGPRWLAAVAAAAIASAAGAGSLAIAGEREAVVRHVAASPAAPDRKAAPSLTPPQPQALSGQAQSHPDGAAEAAARRAAEENFSRLTPEQQARFRDPTAAEYRAICMSGDPADGGFCAGVMFSFLRDAPANGICAPQAAVNGGDRAALGAYVEGGKAQVARLTPQRGEGAVAFAGRALEAAYPCGSTAEAREAGLVEDIFLRPERKALLDFPIALDLASVPDIQAGDTLHLTMEGGGSRGSTFSMPLTPGRSPETPDLKAFSPLFPAGASDLTLTMSAEVRRADRVVATAEPLTLRLARGSQESARRLRPTLSLIPVA